VKILIIGGTQFVGRAIADAAIRAGHDVTLFHRGKTNPEILPKARHVLGDRDGEMDRLAGQQWDWAIDVCGYVPRVVKLSLDALKDSVQRYLFVSTVSVYEDLGTPDSDESAKLLDTDNVEGEEITRDSYGPLKVLCEQAVNNAFGDKGLIVRPGFVIGPHDPTDRMTYWVRRIAREQAVLCPATGEQPMQCIDTRDLGQWIVELVARNDSGTYHVTGPEQKILFTELLQMIRSTVGGDCDFHWVEPRVLEDAEVKPFADLPFWITPAIGSYQLVSISISKALRAGLRLRSLESSIRDILEWDRQRGFPTLSAGLSREREESLLADLSASR
jgi:2'-hydroxyisoflavone reductase